MGVEWRYGVGRAGWDGMDWLDLWNVVVGGGGGGGGGGRSEDGGLGKESGREHQPAPVSSISLATFPPQMRTVPSGFLYSMLKNTPRLLEMF